MCLDLLYRRGGATYIYFKVWGTEKKKGWDVVLTTGVNDQPWSKLTTLHRCQYIYCILNEPKQHRADPRDAKLYVCIILTSEIYLAVVD
jgi:hypothetical protein